MGHDTNGDPPPHPSLLSIAPSTSSRRNSCHDSKKYHQPHSLIGINGHGRDSDEISIHRNGHEPYHMIPTSHPKMMGRIPDGMPIHPPHPFLMRIPPHPRFLPFPPPPHPSMLNMPPSLPTTLPKRKGSRDPYFYVPNPSMLGGREPEGLGIPLPPHPTLLPIRPPLPSLLTIPPPHTLRRNSRHEDYFIVPNNNHQIDYESESYRAHPHPAQVHDIHHHYHEEHAAKNGNHFPSINGSNGLVTPAKPRRASATSSSNNHSHQSDPTTPICRCRVIYLGSAVPYVTKDGLQGIQEPLKDLYPDEVPLFSQDIDEVGVDSWLSVWSNGILIEHVDESMKEVKQFFPIESLHYCAAVRYVVIPNHNSINNESSSTSHTGSNNTTTFATFHAPPPEHCNGDTDTLERKANGNQNGNSHPVTEVDSVKMNGHHSLEMNGHPKLNGNSNGAAASSSVSSSSSLHQTQTESKKSSSKIKFLPLDSPFSRSVEPSLHPPLFACILRRTTGIKVLDCHAFICKRDKAANALVRCCFHAYADFMHAKQMEQELLESQSNYTAVRQTDTFGRRSRSRRNSGDTFGHNSILITDREEGTCHDFSEEDKKRKRKHFRFLSSRRAVSLGPPSPRSLPAGIRVRGRRDSGQLLARNFDRIHL